MSADYFIDSNVFVYHLDESHAGKAAIAERLIRGALLSGDGCIGFQVVQETLNVILKKAEPPLRSDRANRYLEMALLPFMRVPATAELYRRALGVQERYRFAFYDALIVAAALEGGCRRLYSEDLQHGQRIESLTIEDPFRLA